jgi:hypothetical protein
VGGDWDSSDDDLLSSPLRSGSVARRKSDFVRRGAPLAEGAQCHASQPSLSALQLHNTSRVLRPMAAPTSGPERLPDFELPAGILNDCATMESPQLGSV